MRSAEPPSSTINNGRQFTVGRPARWRSAHAPRVRTSSNDGRPQAGETAEGRFSGLDEAAPLLDRVLDAEVDRREALLDEVSTGACARPGTARGRGIGACRCSTARRGRRALPRRRRPRLPRSGGHYETSRELGRGGMAFTARDTKHVATCLNDPQRGPFLGATVSCARCDRGAAAASNAVPRFRAMLTGCCTS
jgi:hypothetical protein